jgi:hemin uptake protein HemP
MSRETVGLAGEMLMTQAEKKEGKRASATARRQLASRDLFGGGNELHIEHNGEIYTLRQTSKGKLILTK